MFWQWMVGAQSTRVTINLDKETEITVNIKSKTDLNFEFSPKVPNTFEHVSGCFTLGLNDQIGELVVEFDYENGVVYDTRGRVCIFNIPSSCDLIVTPVFFNAGGRKLTIDKLIPSTCKLKL
jgi:hypothetical protein